MADTSKTNVDTMTKLIQTDKAFHAEVFPTESRMRQKAKEAEQKKDGTINTGRQKRIKDIEDHHDDCGNDLNSSLLFLTHEETRFVISEGSGGLVGGGG